MSQQIDREIVEQSMAMIDFVCHSDAAQQWPTNTKIDA